MTRALIWNGSLDEPAGQHARVEMPEEPLGAISLQIHCGRDGVWRLTVWKDCDTRSACVGFFSSPEVAKIAAGEIPLDDASVRRMAGAPQPASASGFAEARNVTER